MAETINAMATAATSSAGRRESLLFTTRPPSCGTPVVGLPVVMRPSWALVPGGLGQTTDIRGIAPAWARKGTWGEGGRGWAEGGRGWGGRARRPPQAEDASLADGDRPLRDRSGAGSRERRAHAAELHDGHRVGAGCGVGVGRVPARAGGAVAELPEVVRDGLAADDLQAVEGHGLTRRRTCRREV